MSKEFQIRPNREFVAEKGRNKLLSLPLISESSDSASGTNHVDTMSESHSTISRNAYNFMNNRRHPGVSDPLTQKKNATIRLANYGAQTSPLCVRPFMHMTRDVDLQVP